MNAGRTPAKAPASYEQQIVNANQQALTTAVQQYRTAYAKELKNLPTLLKTAKASPAKQRPPRLPLTHERHVMTDRH